MSRIRVFCNGSLLEDCSHYARGHHLFTELLSPSNWRVNAAAESNLKFYDPSSFGEPTGVKAIDPGEYATGLFTPSALGILSCGKLWPIEMAPFSLEITFAPPTDAVIGDAADDPVGQASSTNYVVNNLHLQCSQVLVDSALNNSFKSLLASGRSLTVAIQSVFTQAHILPAHSNSAQISMVRALSKLGLLFLSFNTSLTSSTEHEATGFGNPSLIVGGAVLPQHNFLIKSTRLASRLSLTASYFLKHPWTV